MKRKPKPLLLNISLYSLLVLHIVLLLALVLVMFKFNELDELYSFFHMNAQQIPISWFIYFPLLLITATLYSIIQMLRRKLHAVYLFYILSFIVFVLLIISSPTEWVNILMLVIVNYVISMYYSWFKKSNDIILENLEQDESLING